MVSRHRLEALSDGVFAIAMTLLVLDLHVPGDGAKGHLRDALVHDAPQWICFFLTFMIAARFWTLQHAVLAALERTGKETTSLTIAFLSMVTILPFTTSLLARHGSDPWSFFMYALDSFALGALLLVQVELARHSGNFASGIEAKTLRAKILPALAPVTFALATVFILPLKICMIGSAATAFIARHSSDLWIQRAWGRWSEKQKGGQPHVKHETGPAELPPEV